MCIRKTNSHINMEYCFVEKSEHIKMFDINTIKYSDNKITLYKSTENLSEKGKKRIARKLKKVLEKKKVEKIILSTDLKKNTELIDKFKEQGIKIIDGKKVMKYLAKEIVEYILECVNKKKEKTKVAILSNEISDIVLEKIKMFALEYKEVTVVTNHPQKVMNLEKELYNNFGTSIIVTNNRKKALLKQEILLNFDFIQEVLDKYNINDEAIIVNFEDNIKIKSKRFSGINICDYTVTCKDKDINVFGNFDCKDLIELMIKLNTSFNKVRENLKNKEVKVESLITYRGCQWGRFFLTIMDCYRIMHL